MKKDDPTKKDLPRMLFVDDDDAMPLTKKYGKILHDKVKIISAKGVTNALRHLNKSPQIDCIITDIRLGSPENDDGLVFAEFLKTHYPRLPVVGISNFANKEAENSLSLEAFYSKASSAGKTKEAVEAMITLAKEHRDRLLAEHHSVFISYGGPDEEIASTINEYLSNRGIKTWFFERDALPGQKLHRAMSEGVNSHDRVLLICSQSSLTRKGVLNEIERVLEREAKEGGADIFIPISIDDYVFSKWAPARADVAQQIQTRVITTFPNEKSEEIKFKESLEKLVAALKR